MMQHYESIKTQLDSVSPSFCIAKWSQLTLYLQTGYNHSCHHPTPHKIPLGEVLNNHKALHNTKFKKVQMSKMLKGERPSECEYCWKIEDLGKGFLSDRVYKSAHDFSQNKFQEIVNAKTEDIEPSYLEISFSNACQLKCAYCSPDISSTWMQEIEQYGGYPTTSNYNNLEWFKEQKKMPYKQSEDNPYVDAFWKWWPELSPKLHTLRLTGGEPLLSKDVWKVIDSVIENPNPKLTFCINTNLLVPDVLIDKLIDKLNQLDGKVKELQIFSSGEASGKANEYMRFGTDDKKWRRNFEKVLSQTKNVLVANMTTVNLTSVGTYCDFLRYLLDLRSIYNKEVSFNKVQFMSNYLRYPEFLAITILDDGAKDKFKKDVEELIEERSKDNWKYDNDGYLTNEQVDQLNRLVEHMYQNKFEDTEKLNTIRKDFYNFVNEYDKRRGTDFKETFPELKEFYKICQEV